jgi:dihydroorotate dehydrogenase
MASELHQNGMRRIGQILIEIEQWMEEREYESVRHVMYEKGMLPRLSI